MSGAEAGAPRRRRFLHIAPLLLFLALAGMFLARLFAGDPSRLPSALAGRPVPDFVLPPLEGLSRDGAPVAGLDAAALRGGRPTLVNVFASWCVPCHEEHPLLMRLAGETGFDLVGVAYKDEPDNSRRFLGAKGNPFARVGVDRSGRAMIDWGVYGVPETFLVDGAGKILFRHVGPLTADSLERLRAMALKAAG